MLIDHTNKLWIQEVISALLFENILSIFLIRQTLLTVTIFSGSMETIKSIADFLKFMKVYLRCTVHILISDHDELLTRLIHIVQHHRNKWKFISIKAIWYHMMPNYCIQKRRSGGSLKWGPMKLVFLIPIKL